jgi:WD40 repeat protein
MGERIVIVLILTVVCFVLYLLYKRGKIPGKIVALGVALVIVVSFVSNVLQQITFIWPELDLLPEAPKSVPTATLILASTPESTQFTEALPNSASTPTSTPFASVPSASLSTQSPNVSSATVDFEINQVASIASGSVHQIAWSPDNSELAVALFRDAIVKMFSPNLDLIRQCKGHTEGVRSVAFSSDGVMLASGGSDATVRLWTWNGSTCKQVRILPHAQPVLAVAFSPKDARLLASAGDDGFIQLWNVSNGKRVAKWQADKQSVSSLVFSADGRSLLSGGSDSAIHVWTLTGTEKGQLIGHTGWVWDMTFDSSGRVLASAGTGDLYNQQVPADNTARLWQWEARKELFILPSGSHYVMTVAFCNSGKYLFSGSRYANSPDKNNLRIWNVDDGSFSAELNGLNEAVTSIRVSPDGNLLAIGTSSAVPWGTENIGNLIIFKLPEVCVTQTKN